jgi:Protein of unknown function (DUF2934)
MAFSVISPHGSSLVHTYAGVCPRHSSESPIPSHALARDLLGAAGDPEEISQSWVILCCPRKWSLWDRHLRADVPESPPFGTGSLLPYKPQNSSWSPAAPGRLAGQRFVVACSQEVMPMPAPARATKSTIKTLSPEERIRRRAYELYVRRGNQSGSELDDWLQAEKEFLQDEVIDEEAAEMFGQP